MQAPPPGLGTPPPPAAPADKSGPPGHRWGCRYEGLSAGGPLATDSQRGTAFLCLRAGEVVGIRGLRPIGIGVPYGYPAASVVLQGAYSPQSTSSISPAGGKDGSGSSNAPGTDGVVTSTAGGTSSPAVIAGCPQAESVRARQNRRSSVFSFCHPADHHGGIFISAAFTIIVVSGQDILMR